MPSNRVIPVAAPVPKAVKLAPIKAPINAKKQSLATAAMEEESATKVQAVVRGNNSRKGQRCVEEPPSAVPQKAPPVAFEISSGAVTVVASSKSGIKAIASPAIGKLVTVAAGREVKGPFIAVPQDLGGLTISGWLVPTVKSPFKGLPAYVIALLLQGCFVGYLVDEIYMQWETACSTPALIQLVAVYVFGATVLQGFTAFQQIQIAMYATHLRSEDRGEEQFFVRKTSSRMRQALVLISVLDLLVEATVFCVGVVFLIGSGSVGDVILNSVAVNFISCVSRLLDPMTCWFTMLPACSLRPSLLTQASLERHPPPQGDRRDPPGRLCS